METDEKWLIGWKSIGAYLGRSAKTAQRWAREGLPFYRDPAGRAIAKRSMIDEYIRDLNQTNYDDKTWQDDGIENALDYAAAKEEERKAFDERSIEAKRPVRSRF